ncbi:MAG: MFS family permease [Cellvibrionaceae bacterium]|jgi:MFS family permease
MKPSKLYYGWWITITLAVTETVSWGIIFYAFSVFITTTEAELGWSRAQITGAFSLSLFMTAAGSYPVGWILDRYGSRLLMTAGSIIATALVFSLSKVESLTMFYIVWAVLGLTASAVLYEPSFVVVARWFTRFRPRALALITFAAGFASTIFLPLTDTLIREFGRQQAWIVLAVILGVITIPLHGLILRKSPESIGLVPDGEPASSISPSANPSTQKASSTGGMTLQEALQDSNFWWFGLAFGLSALSAIAIRVHFIPFLIDGGYSPEFAAWVGGVIGAMQVVGRLAFAPVGERISLKSIVVGIFLLQGGAIMLLMLSPTLISIWTFVILFGAAYGASTLVRTAMLADLYGGESYGRISAVQVTVMRTANMLAPVGAGLIYTMNGNSYRLVLPILVGLAFLAAVAVLKVKTGPSTPQPST